MMESKESVFDLPTDVRQLPGINDPMSRMLYEQHPPTRDVTQTNFPNGQIHHRFEVSGTKRWIPSKSYIRMRCKLGKTIAAGAITARLTTTDEVAPNMGLCANLFQSAEFRIADKTVSRCSDYMAQIDALETRLEKSKSWLDSVGKVTNYWQADVKERIEEVSSDGIEIKSYDERGSFGRLGRARIGLDAAGGGDATSANALSYVTATGVFTLAVNGGAALPAATSVLFPVGSYIVYTAIQGAAATDARLNVPVKVISHPSATTIQGEINKLSADVTADGRTDFDNQRAAAEPSSSRQVDQFELTWQPPLSIFKCDKALPAGRYELVLNPQTSASYKLRAVEALAEKKVSDGDYDFTIDDMYLYVATVESDRIDDLSYYINLDETRCQVDTGLSSTLGQKNFDVSPSTYALTAAFQDASAGSDTRYSASKFKVQNSEELSLTRLFLTYAGQSKPSPDADPNFDAATGADRTVQRYSDSLLQSGQYFREGGAETIQEWHDRGAYYHFAFPRDGRDRSTRVQVNSAIGTPGNARVLLFDHYKSVAHVSVKDGRVVDVSLMEA